MSKHYCPDEYEIAGGVVLEVRRPKTQAGDAVSAPEPRGNSGCIRPLFPRKVPFPRVKRQNRLCILPRESLYASWHEDS